MTFDEYAALTSERRLEAGVNSLVRVAIALRNERLSSFGTASTRDGPTENAPTVDHAPTMTEG